MLLNIDRTDLPMSHLFHLGRARFPRAYDATASKEVINLDGTRRNGMQGTVKAHGRVLGFQVSPTNEQQMHYGNQVPGLQMQNRHTETKFKKLLQRCVLLTERQQ